MISTDLIPYKITNNVIIKIKFKLKEIAKNWIIKRLRASKSYFKCNHCESL